MRSRCLGIFVVLLAVLCSPIEISNAGTEVTVAGFVIDAATGAPIQWASVQISKSNRGAVTLANGSFMIEKLKTGDYKLVAMMMGYEQVYRVVRANNRFNIVVIELPLLPRSN